MAILQEAHEHVDNMLITENYKFNDILFVGVEIKCMGAYSLVSYLSTILSTLNRMNILRSKYFRCSK